MRSTALAGLLTLAALARPAGADEPPSAVDRAIAEVLFRDGKALFDQGKYDEACPKLAESHRLEPKPGTILNLAICHEQQGKTTTAWVELMEAASLAARSKQTEREKFARERMAAVEARLSYVKIEVQEATPGIVVKLDGRMLATAAWASAIPIDPGDHEILVAASDRAMWSGKVRIEPGPSTQTVTVPRLTSAPTAIAPTPEATAAPIVPPAQPAQPPAPSKPTAKAPRPENNASGGMSTGMMLGLAAGGIGVAGVVVGSIFGLATFSKQSKGNAECLDEGLYCSQKGLDLHAEAEASARLSTVGFGVGVAGIGAAVVLILTSRAPKPAAPKTTGSAGLWVAPGVGSGGLAVSAGGAW